MKLTVAAWPSWLLESPATLLITAWLYRPSEGASGYMIYSSGAALEKAVTKPHLSGGLCFRVCTYVLFK